MLNRNIRIILIISLVLIISGCATMHSGDRAANLQCVPFAREKSGIQIYGNAHTWWNKGTKTYARGNKPQKGSVLVLAKTGKLKYGHVAYVKKVISPRKIVVAHANWGKDFLGRGIIYENMEVKDVSKNNDWSRVRFWSPESDNFGLVYPAKGFVYNKAPKKPVQAMAETATPEKKL